MADIGEKTRGAKGEASMVAGESFASNDVFNAVASAKQVLEQMGQKVNIEEVLPATGFKKLSDIEKAWVRRRLRRELQIELPEAFQVDEELLNEKKTVEKAPAADVVPEEKIEMSLEKKAQGFATIIQKNFGRAQDRGDTFSLQEQLDNAKGILGDDGVKLLAEELTKRGIKDLIVSGEAEQGSTPVAVGQAPERKGQRPQREVRYAIQEDRYGKPAVFAVETKTDQDGSTQENSFYKGGIKIPKGIIGTEKEEEYLDLLNEVEKTLRRQVDNEKKVVFFSYTIKGQEEEGKVDIPEEFHDALPLFQMRKKGGILSRDEENRLRLLQKWFLNEVKNVAMNEAATKVFVEKPPTPVPPPAPEAAKAPGPVETATKEQRRIWGDALSDLVNAVKKAREVLDKVKDKVNFDLDELSYHGLSWEDRKVILEKVIQDFDNNLGDEELFKNNKVSLEAILDILDGEFQRIKSEETKKQTAPPAPPAPREAPPAPETSPSAEVEYNNLLALVRDIEAVYGELKASEVEVVYQGKKGGEVMQEVRKITAGAKDKDIHAIDVIKGQLLEILDALMEQRGRVVVEPKTDEQLKAELEKARQEYLDAQKNKEKYSGILGIFRSAGLSRATKDKVKSALKEAEEKYQKARENFTEKDIRKTLQERLALVEAQAKQMAQEKNWAEKTVVAIYKSWHWLGEQNLDNWVKNENRGKWSRRLMRAVSLRTGLGVGLVLTGVAAGPGALGLLTFSARRALSGTGATIGTYDILRAWSEGKAKTEGPLQKVDKEKMANASEEEILKRMAAFELQAEQAGKSVGDLADYKILQELLETKVRASQVEDYLNKQLAALEEAKVTQRRKGKRTKTVQAMVAGAVGIAVGSGVAGDLFNKAKNWLLGETGTPLVAPEHAAIDKHAVAELGIKHPSLELPQELHGVDNIAGLKVSDLSQEQLKQLMHDASIRHGEGVTSAIARQLKDNAQHFGFKGNIHDKMALEHWAQKASAKIAKETGYIKADGSETWIKNEGEDVRYFLTQDAQGHAHIVKSAQAAISEYSVDAEKARHAREVVRMARHLGISEEEAAKKMRGVVEPKIEPIVRPSAERIAVLSRANFVEVGNAVDAKFHGKNVKIASFVTSDVPGAVEVNVVYGADGKRIGFFAERKVHTHTPKGGWPKNIPERYEIMEETHEADVGREAIKILGVPETWDKMKENLLSNTIKIEEKMKTFKEFLRSHGGRIDKRLYGDVRLKGDQLYWENKKILRPEQFAKLLKVIEGARKTFGI